MIGRPQCLTRRPNWPSDGAVERLYELLIGRNLLEKGLSNQNDIL